MKIEEVKKLDNGVSGITIEGKIIKTPKPPGDSEYGWSQMIILKDDTGEMGSWINIENAENAYKVGQYIKVQGKVSKYTKGGKPGISLNNGKVIEEITQVEKVSQETSQETPQETSQEKPLEKLKAVFNEKVDDKVWEKKDLRMARESALKNITQFVVAKIVKLNERFKYAQEDVDFIYKDMGLTSEDITKEFGGTKEEVKEKPTKKTKETEEEDWATEKQVALIKKSVVTSHLLTDPEKEKIEGFLKEGLSKTKAGEIICWWLGDIVEDIKGQRSIRGEAEKEDPTKADKEEKIKKARTIVKAHGSVEVKDKTAPFPDEKITDEDIPGSSYNNAIPF